MQRWKEIAKEVKKIFGDVEIEHRGRSHGVCFRTYILTVDDSRIQELASSKHGVSLTVVPATDWKNKTWVYVLVNPKKLHPEEIEDEEVKA